MSSIHIISGDAWGGKEAQMLLQLKEFSKDNNLKIILFNSAETHKKYINAGLDCIVIEESCGFSNLARDAVKLVTKDSIIFAHGYKEFFLALYLKFKTRCKVVVTFHGMAEPNISTLKDIRSKFTFYSQVNFAKLFADKIICVSDALKRNLGLNNAIVIRNCVELPVVSSDRSTLNNPKIVFMAGRLVPVKRYDLAIKAVSDLSENVELHIAGNGILRQQLELSAGEKVKFLGFRNDIAELLNSADVFLICSDSEGIPTILLEALAAGVKCIATSVGGIPEVVKSFPNGACVLIPPGDSKAISNALSEVLKSDQKLDINEVRSIIETEYSAKRAAKELSSSLFLL